MMSQTMFSYFVDRRLRQATGHLNRPLSGITVLLLGDFDTAHHFF